MELELNLNYLYNYHSTIFDIFNQYFVCGFSVPLSTAPASPGSGREAIFIGDDGQGDVQAAVSMATFGPPFAAAFIHQVAEKAGRLGDRAS